MKTYLKTQMICKSLFTICTKNSYDGDGRKKFQQIIKYLIIILITILNFNLGNFEIFQIFFLAPRRTNKRYLSLPPTWQDLTQGQWPEGRIIVGLKERKVGQEQRVIGSLKHKIG